MSVLLQTKTVGCTTTGTRTVEILNPALCRITCVKISGTALSYSDLQVMEEFHLEGAQYSWLMDCPLISSIAITPCQASL